MLLFVCSEAAESKLVKLETSLTVILPPIVECSLAVAYNKQLEDHIKKIQLNLFKAEESGSHLAWSSLFEMMLIMTNKKEEKGCQQSNKQMMCGIKNFFFSANCQRRKGEKLKKRSE